VDPADVIPAPAAPTYVGDAPWALESPQQPAVQAPPAVSPPLQTPTAEPAPTARPSVRVLPLLGAVAMIVSTALPWLEGFASANAFDVPLSFLFAPESAGESGLSLGIVLLAVGGVGAAGSFPFLPDAVRKVVGTAASLSTLGFAGQLYRLASDAGAAGDVVQLLGIGAYLGLAGGVVLAWAR
jgi:hypothetical protein